MLTGLGWLLHGNSAASTTAEREAVRNILKVNIETANETINRPGIEGPKATGEAINEYMTRMNDVDLSGCPATFRVAFKHYLATWNDLRRLGKVPRQLRRGACSGRVQRLLPLRKRRGTDRMSAEIQEALKSVQHSYEEVEKIAAGYGVVYPEKN